MERECGDTLVALMCDVARDHIRWAQSMAVAGVGVPNGGLMAAMLVDADEAYKYRLRRGLGFLFPLQVLPLEDAGPCVAETSAV